VTRTAFVQPAEGPSYDLGADHPMQPMRRRLAVDLMDAYGLPERDGVGR
jgi:hypothetical protein